MEFPVIGSLSRAVKIVTNGDPPHDPAVAAFHVALATNGHTVAIADDSKLVICEIDGSHSTTIQLQRYCIYFC